MVRLEEARAPEDMRLYALGDVHGCLEALRAMDQTIRADLAARPVADWRIVFVGDYTDRGRDSRGVIDFLVARAEEDHRVLCLRGNHDEMFARALEGEPRDVDLWLMNGGVETLESYGVPLVHFLDDARERRAGLDAVPATHRTFLERLSMSARFGDYYFVHAGIDPDRALDDQDPHDQLWMREPFLTSDSAFEAVVVHGHTPVRRVEVRQNRIGIDTGAVYGGSLTCLVLEGQAKHLLCADGLVPLPRA